MLKQCLPWCHLALWGKQHQTKHWESLKKFLLWILLNLLQFSETSSLLFVVDGLRVETSVLVYLVKECPLVISEILHSKQQGLTNPRMYFLT